MKHLGMKSKLLVLLSLLLACHAAQASQEAMDTVQATTDKLIDRLLAEKKAIDSKPETVLNIVQEIVLPNVATKNISKRVLGSHWSKASKDQQERFTQAFETSLVRFYAKVFASYNNQKFEYLSATATQNGTVLVKTRILSEGEEPVAVHYDMRQTRSGKWLIVDIVVDDVSLVANNYSTFFGQVAQHGLEEVINKLVEKNARPFKG